MNSSRKRALRPEELEYITENLSEIDDEDPFHDSDDSRDPDYEESSNSESDCENDPRETIPQDLYESDDQSEQEDEIDTLNYSNSRPAKATPKATPEKYKWSVNVENFQTKYLIPPEESGLVVANISRCVTAIQCFLKLFPRSLSMQIASYTNQRLDILAKSKSKTLEPTCTGGVMVILGCSIVMAYNRVPSMHMYWSRNISLGNRAISKNISRDRFLLISSKLYFNQPEKPNDAPKYYYIDDVVNCSREKFLKSRTDSSFQSIDESMATFKGRSSLKQTRINTPKFFGKFDQRGECEMVGCEERILGIRWKDTKDVCLMSNCHDSTVVRRKMKDGTSKEIDCPEAIVFYNCNMGGVDLADQMIPSYEHDRKSRKWWKKVFFRLLMTAVYNAYIIYTEVNKKKIPYIDFVIDVAKSLISLGRAEFPKNNPVGKEDPPKELSFLPI
ncbi:hypothetical protein JTB14_017912 [Gonioctena quinquepunctata]|nr:hypothetical protein JTB14_017912 [Gonioctena quinquepunctata]